MADHRFREDELELNDQHFTALGHRTAADDLANAVVEGSLAALSRTV